MDLFLMLKEQVELFPEMHTHLQIAEDQSAKASRHVENANAAVVSSHGEVNEALNELGAAIRKYDKSFHDKR